MDGRGEQRVAGRGEPYRRHEVFGVPLGLAAHHMVMPGMAGTGGSGGTDQDGGGPALGVTRDSE